MHIIQVVGTNGKGSTVAFVESILNSAGVATGLFTSPHLSTARERIRINGEMVTEHDFVQAARFVLRASESLSEEVSFFECMLGMALWLFQKRGVRVAILEAGVGGRLDATTAAAADVLGVTMIDYDHQQFLGTTIDAIAHEKINAARALQTVVTVKQTEEAIGAIERAQKVIGFNLMHAGVATTDLPLFGEHQRANAGLAIALVQNLFPTLSQEAINQGLKKAFWPGRFEVLNHEVPVVLDGAHNPSGIASLVTSLRAHPQFLGKPLVLVYGSLAGTSMADKVTTLLSGRLDICHVFLHAPQNPRAVTVPELRALFESRGIERESISDFSTWSHVSNLAQKRKAAIVVCGSLYTVGEMRSVLLACPKDEVMPNF